MSEVLIYRLRQNREVILDDLEADQVLNYLYGADVLDCDKYEEVRDEKPRKKQAALLLSHVERDSTAIEKMIEGLEGTSQRHLANILKEPLPDEVNLCKGILKSFHNNTDDCFIYPMNRVPCGYAVIINNSKFDTDAELMLECREGSEVDVMNMTELFQHLQFNVDVYTEKSALEILHIVRKYSIEDEPKHKNFDCFVLFLMSHGFPGGIYGKDCKKVHIKTIKENLTAGKCFGLANKPKLIFVQACRGGKPDRAFVLTDSPCRSGKVPSEESQGLYDFATPALSDFESVTPSNDLPEVDVTYIPTDADIYTAYASTAAYAAHRNTQTGGWFVTQLNEVFRKYADKEDLEAMMTRVARGVSMMRSAKINGMQCPERGGNLRGKVFFKPKKL